MLRLAKSCLIALTILHPLAAFGEPQIDAGWELLTTSAGDEVPRVCMPTSSLPSWVSGSFFIAGPAKFEMGGFAFKSLFDGYGRTNRFEMHNGKVCYTSAWLNTSYYLAAKKLGRIGPGVLFEDTIPPRPKCPISHLACDLTAPMDNNWVNLLPLGDEALLLTDAPLMLNFNLETLAVSGEHHWEDNALSYSKVHKPTTGSAHPLLRPGTEATYIDIASMLPISPFAHFEIAVYSIDAKAGKERSLVAKVPAKGLMYFHSYGVTENYVVLPMNMKMGASMKSLTHRPTILSGFEDGWDGIHVVDLNGNVQVFNTDPFYHVHIANTFENATGIVMDLGVSDQIPFRDGPTLTTAKFTNKTLRDVKSGLNGVLRRYHLHTSGPSNGIVTYETLSVPGRMSDFYKINPAKNGRDYCFVYLSEWFHDDSAYASMAIMKLDVCQGKKKYWHINNTYPGEPTFIAQPGGSSEDDGIVVFVALDGMKKNSNYVILDGKTFNEIAVVPLPQHIPFTAHGLFFPGVGKAAALAIASGSDPKVAVAEAVSDATHYIV